MQPNNRFHISPQVVVLVVLIFVVLPICLFIYSKRSNAYTATAPVKGIVSFTNPLVLENWLPNDSYNYTVARINDYLSLNNPNAPDSSMTILGGVSIYTGTFTFTLELLPTEVSHQVSVRVVNYGGVLSTAVYIDNSLQDPIIPKAVGRTSYSGLDNLTDQGLTVFQIRGLQQAFQSFDPSANSVSANDDVVTSNTDPSKPPVVVLYNFTVSVDGTTYKAQLQLPNDNSTRLILRDAKNNSIVFDSGQVPNGY